MQRGAAAQQLRHSLRFVSLWFPLPFSHGPVIGLVIPSITQLYSEAGSKGSTRERHFFVSFAIIEEKKSFPETLEQTSPGMSLARNGSCAHC